MLEQQRIKKRHASTQKVSQQSRRMSRIPSQKSGSSSSKAMKQVGFTRNRSSKRNMLSSKEEKILKALDKDPASPDPILTPGKIQAQVTEEDDMYIETRPMCEAVDLNLIKDNICTKKTCYTKGSAGKPHRHRVKQCKDHPYCLDDPIGERIPTFSKLPQPIPFPNPNDRILMNSYLDGVDNKRFGETGPLTEDTRVIPTQYSLDHYWAQQWNLDIDNMPGNLPEKLEAVQKKFQRYSRRLINKGPVKQTSKPTLQKKLNQWNKAQEEMRQQGVELAYWQSNMDPKLYAVLQSYNEKPSGQQTRANSTNVSASGQKIGKYTKMEVLSLASPKDMIPMVYPTSMSPEPVINQLNREHEEITRAHAANPGAQFSDLTEKYYAKKEKTERDNFKRMLLGQGAKQKRENYLPSKAVKKRMDSEHLNSFMKHGEIQEVAERYIEFQNLLANMTEEERDALRQTSTKPSNIVTAPEGSHSKERDGASSAHDFLAATQGLKQAVALNQRSRASQRQGIRTDSKQDQMSVLTHPTQQPQKSVAFLDKPQELKQQPMSTSASSAAHKMQRDQTPLNSLPSSKNRPNRRARLFSAKPSGVTSYAVHSQLNQQSSFMPSVQGMMGMENLSPLASDVPSMTNLNETAAGPHTRTQTSLNKTGAVSKSGHNTPTRTKSYTVMLQQRQGTSNNVAREASKTGDYEDRKRDVPHLYLQENDHLNENSGSVHDLNTPADDRKIKSIFSTKNLNSNILNDLISAQDFDDAQMGRDGIKQIFGSKKWQQDKNHLIASMQFHMARHRPQIQLSNEQEIRKVELSSKKIFGDALLQKRLAHQYCYKQDNPVEIPIECQTFMGEVPALMANKLKQDNKAWQGRKDNKDLCSKEALYQKAFETLNKSTQQSEVGGTQVSGRSMVQRAQVNVSSHRSSSANLTIPTQRMEQYQRRSKPSGVPNDPKPDVHDMTEQRFESFKQTFMGKICEVTKRKKPQWQIDASGDLYAASEFGGQESCVSLNKHATHNSSMAKTSMAGRNESTKNLAENKPPTLQLTLHQTSRNQGQLSSLRKRSQRSPNRGSGGGSPKNRRVSPGRSRATTVQHLMTSTVNSKTATQQNDISKKSAYVPGNISKSDWEPASPGFGSPPTGQEQAQIIKKIQMALDNEIQEQPYKKQSGMELTMPELEWDTQQLNFLQKSMNHYEFWQQKGLQCSKQGKVDAAMDYYRQGLRRSPTEHVLIYSVACCYSQLRKYKSAMQWYSLGISLHPRWVDGLCGISFAFFNMGQYEKALYYITLAKENSKGSLLTNSQLNYEITCFVHATCLKNTRRLDESSKAYYHLEDYFVRERKQDFKLLLWGTILIPLSDQRKTVADHWIRIKEYLEHLSEEPIPLMEDQNLLLSKFCIGAKKNINYKTGQLFNHVHDQPSKKLDLKAFPKAIMQLLNHKSFFKRFANLKAKASIELYRQVLQRAEIELFSKDQTVFLKDRIAVVAMGSVEIRSHKEFSLLKPIIVKKAIEGDIMGFAEGDNNLSGSPLTWLVSMQDQTEIVFIQKDDWARLWGIQKNFTEQQIALNKLEQNDYFMTLNMITKYHLVYETLELKIFYPGQLIMSVHERSPLCEATQEFYLDGTSKFRKEIDNKILKSQENLMPKKSLMGGFFQALNSGEASPEQKLMQKRLQGFGKTTDTPNFSGQYNSSVTQSSPYCSLSKDGGASSTRKERARAQQEAVQNMKLQAEKMLQSDTESNSTDYGISHAKELLRPGRRYSNDSLEDGLMHLELSKSNDESLKTTEEEIEENSFKPNVSDIPELGIIENPDAEDDSSLERDDTQGDVTFGNQSTPKGITINKKSTIKKNNASLSPPRRKQLVEKRNVSASPNPKSRPAWKRQLDQVVSSVTGFDGQQNYNQFDNSPQMMRITTNSRRLTKKFSSSKQVTIRIKNQDGDMKSYTANAMNSVKLQEMTDEQPNSSDIRVSDLNQKLRKSPNKKMTGASTNFKFLMQKQATAIMSRDRAAKREHRRRKAQMKSLLTFCREIQNSILKQPKLSNQDILQSLKSVHLDQKDKESQLSLVSKNTVQQTRQIGQTIEKLATQQSSGIGNSILVEQVNQMIEKISEKVGHYENSQEILYQAIVQAIEQCAEVKGGRREEPVGVHFIDQGEVYVVDKEYAALQRLAKTDTFGMCDILRKVGPEFVGDVRAGIRQVQTFYFPHAAFMKRLSNIEKIRLKTLEPRHDKMLSVVSLLSTKTGIEESRLMRF